MTAGSVGSPKPPMSSATTGSSSIAPMELPQAGQKARLE